MNRLTKQISLVLISSSLFLLGCGPRQVQGEKKDKDDPTGTSHGHYPLFFHGGGGSSTVPSGGSSSVRSGFGSSAAGVGGAAPAGVGS